MKADEKNETQKALKNSVWVILSKIINIVIGLFASILVTRYLGAEQKGIMADASAISSLFGFIAGFGIMDILISKFASEYQKSGIIAATGMFLMLLGGSLAFVVTLAFALCLGVTRQVFIYVVICTLPYFYHFLFVFEYWFYSRSNSKSYAIAQSIIHIIILFVRVAGVPLKAPLTFFIVITILESALVEISALVCYKKSDDHFIGSFCVDFNLAKEMAKLALPMILSGFASAVYLKIDQIMIGKLMGHVELGLYSVAVTLAEYWYFVPSSLNSSFLPVLSSNAGDENAYYNRLQKFADLVVFIGYIAAIGVMICGRWGINLLYGSEFDGSAAILMIYIWSGVFTCLALPANSTYLIKKDTKLILIINIAGALINFLLNLLLIQQLGAIGAALATLLEYMIVAFGQMIILRGKYRKLYITQLKSLFPFVRIAKYGYEAISSRM
ncbi:Membrane protein involved in the export of O-antigen and teichoic acid [Butyrivibrio proteoclasticus]|uniref:Membrane protein involved in the export of O-antigen and teichoic acid n=1 Tax=Butyrivibrio proteoclasticus TaxID=43305 RepID=A0A1I5PQ75_9FIRM|nr:flippase [Butyrivibrio proteoclasticus]SFP36165.1 Membrane protein involved in the export of O-antigen and teichoic acid [Butyrivibrio proteoclasticus]